MFMFLCYANSLIKYEEFQENDDIGERISTCMERTAAIVKISSEHPSSSEAKIIFEIIGSYIKLNIFSSKNHEISIHSV